MANSKSSIYPIQLKNAELNLNKYDAEIKQYTGFNKNNAPFVGGCLSNLFTKDNPISGSTNDNTYIDNNGDVYQATPEGLLKNNEKVLDIDTDNLYAVEELDINYDVVELFDEYAFIYREMIEDGTFNYYFKYFDFNTEEWLTELLINYNNLSNIFFSLKRIKYNDNSYAWIIGSQRNVPSTSMSAALSIKVFIYSSIKTGTETKHGSYQTEDTEDFIEYCDRTTLVLCTLHCLYNSTLGKFYIVFFANNPMSASSVSALYDDTSKFCHIYSAEVIESETISYNFNIITSVNSIANSTNYFSFLNDITASDFQIFSNYVYHGSSHNPYFVLNSRIWLFGGGSTGTSNKKIQHCDVTLIPDNSLGVKIQFSNPLYTFENTSGYTFNNGVKLFNFGVLSATADTSWRAHGYCDFITVGVSVSSDNYGTRYAKFNTGAVLNDVVLMNNETVTGLTLPGMQKILVADWNSVDENNIYLLNYQTSNYDVNNNTVVIYKANGTFKKLTKTDKIILRRIGDQLVINSEMLQNAYRMTDGKKLLFAPSWNNRIPIEGGADITEGSDHTGNNYYVASSMNEYNLDDNASILLNPLPIANPIHINVAGNRLNENIPELINFYGGETAAEIKYLFSGIDNNLEKKYICNNLVDLPFPIDSNGNVQLCPSLFSEVKNIYGNEIFIKDGGTFYPLMTGNVNQNIMSFYISAGLDNINEGFIIQGQFYGLMNNGIYTVQYNNGVINGFQFVVSVEGLQFCGNTPYQAIFFSKTNRCLYAFTGANVLNVMQAIDKISEVRDYKYNPATQSIFLITDTGVIINGLFGTYQIDYPNITKIFLLNNGFVLNDGSTTYRYIKYYKDTDDGYTKQNIELDTCFYGMDNQTVTINDCLYLRLFSEEHEEGSLEVSAVTLSLKGRKTEKTTFRIKAGDWDKETHTIYLRYQPKEQRGLGISFKINSPFKIASMSVGSQPDAILIDKVSKGAVNAPLSTSSNINW